MGNVSDFGYIAGNKYKHVIPSVVWGNKITNSSDNVMMTLPTPPTGYKYAQYAVFAACSDSAYNAICASTSNNEVTVYLRHIASGNMAANVTTVIKVLAFAYSTT